MMPVVEPTVANEVDVLDHVPPEVASAYVIVEPTHTLSLVKVMAEGGAATVI